MQVSYVGFLRGRGEVWCMTVIRGLDRDSRDNCVLEWVKTWLNVGPAYQNEVVQHWANPAIRRRIG